jgi:hypothetical protein
MNRQSEYAWSQQLIVVLGDQIVAASRQFKQHFSADIEKIVCADIKLRRLRMMRWIEAMR